MGQVFDITQSSPEWSPFPGLTGEQIVRGDGLFREVLDALPAAVYITDAEGQIAY
jgi:hypothetical protein